MTSPAGAAPPDTPASVRIHRVAAPPRLRDYLHGGFRPEETRITGFRQFEPGDGLPASRNTTAYLSYDDKNLYVIFVCSDDPKKVRARLARREDIQDDDRVGVVLDTFHDRHRAYRFYVNAFGVQADSVITEGQKEDTAFDTVWQSEGQRTAEGYVVRIAIPFLSLRFPHQAEQTWGIALARVIAGRNETAYWPTITARVAGFVQQLATLEGLDGISPGNNGQFIPHSVFSRARFLDSSAPAGPGFRKDSDAGVGMDAKLVLRDAVTLDVTVNPDVSQVESDEPQVTINRRFEVSYPEKRPFFTDNAGFFQTREELFHSRRLLDPQYGARLTGKAGRWAFGALAMDDRDPGARQPESSALRGERTYVGVVRAQREFANQSSVGAFVSTRDFGPAFNRVFSLDTRLKLDAHWTFAAQAARSYTRTLALARKIGAGYSASISRNGRHFTYGGSYLERSPGFRAELGFIPRVDIRSVAHSAAYLWRPKRGWVLSFGPSVFSYVDWDTRGRLQDRGEGAGFGVDFARQTHVAAAYSHGFERYLNLRFQRNYENASFWTGALKWLFFSAYYGRGASINYHPAPGLDPFAAASTDGVVGLTLRFTPRLRWGQDYVYSRLGTRPGFMAAGSRPGAVIFTDHITRSKLTYQFTRALSLRAIFDYDAVLANSALIADRGSKHAGADFLLTYLVNPGTAIYAGYTDGYDNIALSATAPATLRFTPAPTTSTGRQVFVKLSYLLRF